MTTDIQDEIGGLLERVKPPGTRFVVIDEMNGGQAWGPFDEWNDAQMWAEVMIDGESYVLPLYKKESQEK